MQKNNDTAMLYENILTIQNAADLERPAADPVNAGAHGRIFAWHFPARSRRQPHATAFRACKMKIESINSLFGYLLLAIGVAGSYSASGQTSISEENTLQISGHYSYVFSNGAPAKTNDYDFIALTTPSGWEITATNVNQPREWGSIRYDGTNIYELEANRLNGFKLYGYVYPGRFYVPYAADTPYLFFPWMVFHLTPEMLQQRSEPNGLITAPAPWGARFSLLDYGFRWEVHTFENGKLIQSIKVVRDQALDLKTKEAELRRASVDYPFSYSPLAHRLTTLEGRKFFPDGFVHAIYKCESVCHTNGWLIPFAASFDLYYPRRDLTSQLVYELSLRIDQIKFSPTEKVPVVAPPARAYVFDYRYQATNSRTKFNHATYTLNAGEAFPPDNDPKLLEQAQEWLKHGPAYNDLQSKRRVILVGMLTVTFLTSGLLIFWLIKSKTNTKT